MKEINWDKNIRKIVIYTKIDLMLNYCSEIKIKYQLYPFHSFVDYFFNKDYLIDKKMDKHIANVGQKLLKD